MKHTILFAAMLCVSMTATANNAKISGRIKDANDKSAIIGATVLLMQEPPTAMASSRLTRTQEIIFWNFPISVMKQSAWLLP